MKTAYIDLPLSLLYYSTQISDYALSQGYVPLNPFIILNRIVPQNEEAVKKIKELADEIWSFRTGKKFPKEAQRKFRIINSQTIEEIL